MSIQEWLFESMVRLREAGVDSPRRDCLVLIEDLLDKDRAWVLSHHEQPLTIAQVNLLNKQLKRRIVREPLAYVRGKAWFYGRFFVVNPDVLIPRPESESFIDIIKNSTSNESWAVDSILDVGTGSGCLAITAKLEIPDAKVTAIDNSGKALKIAQQNAEFQGVNVGFYVSDLQQLFSAGSDVKWTKNTVFMVNLPYVPENEISSPEITREPAEALFSGDDGLDHYNEFWKLLKESAVQPEYVLCESLHTQHKKQKEMAESAGYKLAKTETLVQVFIKK